MRKYFRFTPLAMAGIVGKLKFVAGALMLGYGILFQ